MAGGELLKEPSAQTFAWTERQAELVWFSVQHNCCKPALSTTGGMQEQRPQKPGVQLKSRNPKPGISHGSIPESLASFSRRKSPENFYPEQWVASASINIRFFFIQGGVKEEYEMVSSYGLDNVT